MKANIIFIFSPERWGLMKLSKHHYAISLAAKGHQVYFFEPGWPQRQQDEVEQLLPNLYLVQYKLRARGRDKLPGWLYSILLRREVAYWQTLVKAKPDIIWFFETERLNRLPYFHNTLKIFHPVDFFKTVFLAHKPHIDICFSTIQKQVLQLHQLGYKAHFVNHGLSEEFVTYATKRLQQTMAATQPKHILQAGYVGNLLSEPPDRVMMQQIISGHPDIQFHFWGQYDPNGSNLFNYLFPEVLEFIDFLKAQPNVQLHGSVNTTTLAAAMQQMDLFWICWNVTRPGNMWNKDTNPHKIIEYLSTGKPVVAHFMEHYKNLPLLYMTSTIENHTYEAVFNKAVDAVRNGEPKKHVEDRIRFALDNTYQKHIEQIFSLLPQQTSC